MFKNGFRAHKTMYVSKQDKLRAQLFHIAHSESGNSRKIQQDKMRQI
jgi:hypothetical protein